MSKRKYNKEFKLNVLKEHHEGASFYSLEKKYDITLGTVKRWNAAFKAQGESAFDYHEYSCSSVPMFRRNGYR